MEWKNHPVTREVLEILGKRLYILKEELLYISDRVEFKQGYAAALNDVLNIDIKEVIEDAS